MAGGWGALRRCVQRHALLLDVALGAAIATIATIALWSEPEFIRYDFREPDALGVGLAVLGGVAVAMRSVWPVAALVVAAAASTVPLQLGYSQTIGGLPALLTLYSVAVRRPARVSRAALAVLGALVAAVLVTGPLEPTAGDWVANTFVLVTGWALGRSVRGRRAYTAGLEERNRALLAARDSQTRAALVDERSRIAREMQDLVAHTLTAMTVQAAAARRLVRSDPDTAEHVLDTVETSGRYALEELRRILGVLDPDGGADRRPQPGVADLHVLVEQARSDGLDVELTAVGQPVAVEAGVELTAYRLVQEALANAHRHAGPARVRIVLRWQGESLGVAVEDDGRGLLPRDAAAPQGHGLESLRQRVLAYGGRLRAGPRRGGGFAVTATLPTTGARP